MILLKNKAAFNKWRKQPAQSNDLISEPLEFPCYVYLTVLSFGYEELQANYLYCYDLYNMTSIIKDELSKGAIPTPKSLKTRVK